MPGIGRKRRSAIDRSVFGLFGNQLVGYLLVHDDSAFFRPEMREVYLEPALPGDQLIIDVAVFRHGDGGHRALGLIRLVDPDAVHQSKPLSFYAAFRLLRLARRRRWTGAATGIVTGPAGCQPAAR